MSKEKLTPKQAMEKAITEAVKYLTAEQCRQVLEFIALLPGEGKGEIYPKKGGTETDS